MILCDHEIKKALNDKKIFIEPLPSIEQYTSSAVDLILGSEVLVPKSAAELHGGKVNGVETPIIIVPAKVDINNYLKKYWKELPKESDGSVIAIPGQLILAMTREYINLPKKSKIAARVEGRSTLARLGLAVHLTAPIIHCGFSGTIALEMCNFGKYPLRLEPNKLNICQLVLERVGRTPKGPVRTRFLGQTGLR